MGACRCWCPQCCQARCCWLGARCAGASGVCHGERAAFGAPLADFFVRFGKLALPILALICLYRLSDFVLNIMNPFYQDLGFNKIEIAEVRKVFGVIIQRRAS